MSLPLNIILLLILLLVGIIIYIIAFYFLKIKHLIQNTPTSKIRSVAMGFAEVGGKVIPYEDYGTMMSPFSNEKCVYYRYLIEEYRSTGKSSSWVTIKKGTENRLFYIQDETGRILVDPNKASIDISKSNVYNSAMGKDPPQNVLRFLEMENIRFEGILFGINKRMRYTEYIIKPYDSLYIMGTVEDNPYVQDASVIDGVADMIFTKGKNVKFYCISDKMEKRILTKYNLLFIGFFLLGTFISVLSLIAILQAVM